ncbi:MAG: hypothetical protein QXX68_01955 [Candidatus Pacearchaeota archaeon]
MKNKKANLDIVIFTIMVLIICVYALVKIASYNEKFEFRLKGYDSIEEIQLEKKDMEYRLEKYLEECTYYSYYNLTKNKKFYEEKEIEEILFFDKMKKDINESLNNATKNCLKIKAINEYNSFQNKNNYTYKKILIEKIKDLNFDLFLDDEKINIKLKEIEFKVPEITKKDKLNAEIIFKKIGLLPFYDIHKTLECKKDMDCMNNITKNLFDVKVEEKKENKNNKTITYSIYNFTSIRDFYINEEFNKINFEIKILEEIKEDSP